MNVSLVEITMTFIGLNIDTFIALLSLINKHSDKSIILGYSLANLTLWILGVLISKSIAVFFPDWITGFMGIILIILAFRPYKENKIESFSDLREIFTLCFSLGGDNLSVYIPMAVKMQFMEILFISLVFIVFTFLTVLLGKLVLKINILTDIIENYGGYSTKLVYIIAGIYIVVKSKLLLHLF